MLETCTVSGFHTASILSLGHRQINVKLHLFLPEPRPSAKSQVDTPAPGVCRSLFPRGNVLKAEIVRLVTGLGVLEQHPV